MKSHHKLKEKATVGEMPQYDKQGIISLLYKKFTQISVWPRQVPPTPSRIPLLIHTRNCQVPTKKKRLQLLSPSFQDHCAFLLPQSFASYPDALFLLSPVSQEVQINSLILISDFPQDPASETLLSTLLCNLQASNNSPQAPGIPYPTNSSQSPTYWLLPALGKQKSKQLNN